MYAIAPPLPYGGYPPANPMTRSLWNTSTLTHIEAYVTTVLPDPHVRGARLLSTILRLTAALVLSSLLFACEPVSQGLASGIPGVVAAGATVELVRDGFQFAEGPVGAADGGLYFTDLRANAIYRLNPSGGIDIVRDKTAAANGLAFDQSGNLFAAEGDGQRVIRIDSRGAVATVATQTALGQAFRRPNDLIVDRRGGIYVTDPGPRGHQGNGFVYYIRPDTRVLLVSDEIRQPNGVTLTQDEKGLLVADTLGNIVFAFDVQADGSATNRRPFANLRGIPQGKPSIADGIALDSAGRLYVATVTGVQVFDAGGRYLGTLAVPRQPANLAFSGPDKRILYITAREGLYRVRTLSQGPDRPGK
jgi:gluconolactonase